ncbi:MAG TPA: SAF domain-containing protein [Solirubrobacterales bacterium]|nr:SAF domain-containing protein [Solirubrobacterales bacterium]
MSRRGRAVAFLLLALAAAAIAAGVANGYGSSIAQGYGALRPVVVLGTDLPAGEPIGPRELSSALEVRRVPVRFVPPGTLAAPGDALGLAPKTMLPAGSYLLAAQLRPPERGGATVGLGGDRRPVEIAVSGAGALLASDPDPAAARVDVVVTEEPTGSGPGRTYVAASAVPLIALAPGPDGPGPGGLSSATLGLTRRQALKLIAAQNFARQVTLLPGG